MAQEFIAIAVVKRAVGLEGYCGALPFGKTFSYLKPPVLVRLGSNENSSREVTLENVISREQGYIVRFDIAHDRTEAEKLKGENIYIREDNLPALEEGEFYHFHLKGMAVVNQSNGAKIGMVKDVVNLPSMDALEITLNNGHEIVVPYNEQAVIKVDIEEKRITVSDTYIEELL
ncbi:MAG: ribosome maturation factor RimM [Chitinispirillales bacterium]|jgi:16S rRNA processing protein RimM|nr:ribosome maturation factor RimM [Chitinispirillales bacterium]